MEIITPQQLWEGYDRSASPDATIISQNQDKTELKLYFNGFNMGGSVVRIYARLVLPTPLKNAVNIDQSAQNATDLSGLEHIKSDLVCGENENKDSLKSIENKGSSKKPPVIMLFSPALSDIDKVDHSFFTDRGFAVLLVDYFGNLKEKQHFTIYPKTLDAFWETDPSLINVPPSNPKTSCWYYFTTCVLHAVTYLQECDLIDANRIGIVGTDEGASLVFKASLCNAIKAGISFFSGDLIGSGEEYLAYKASLDSRAYAKSSYPILINAATNESTNSFDYLNELYTVCPNTCFCIFSLAARATSQNQQNNVKAWFNSAFNGESIIKDKPAINAPVMDGLAAASLRPSLTVFGSEGALYAEVISESESITIFYAEASEAAVRNWKKIVPSKIAEKKYLTKVEIISPEKPIHIFATITYESGFTLSTAAVEKNPAKLGVTASPMVSSRLIYESISGVEGFLTLGDGIFAYPPVFTKGPLDIEGVKSDLLITYKPNDIRYAGRPESLLQLMISAEKAQEIEISLIEKDTSDEYKALKKVAGNSWTTVTLSSEDFKSGKGLISFDRVVGIKIKGSGLILNSMFWV